MSTPSGHTYLAFTISKVHVCMYKESQLKLPCSCPLLLREAFQFCSFLSTFSMS